MRTPPIMRAVVSDVRGDVLFDSAEPRYRQPALARPPIVRRYAQPPLPVESSAGRSLSALIAGLAIALAAGGALVALALIARVST